MNIADGPALRPMRDDDIAFVLELNDANVALTAPMDRDRLLWMQAMADRLDVVELRGARAGFVVTFGPTTTYDSPNYLWFQQKFGDAFGYLDRIVLHEDFRRQGLGGVVYDACEASAGASYGRLA